MITRRTLLTAAGAAALATGLRPWPAAAAATPADFAAARSTVRDILTGGAVPAGDPLVVQARAALDASANAVASLIDRRPGRDRVFTDLPLDPANTRTTYDRLRDLALAYATPGAARYGDPATESDLLAGLATAHDRSYHVGGPTSGNWWFWEIGSPRPLLWTCLLLGGALPAVERADYVAAVRFYVPDPTRHRLLNGSTSVGANRSDLCEIAVLDGMLDENEARVLSGRNALSALLPRTRSGDGFYADGSFIQHGVFAYTGSYGMVQVGGMARLFAMLAATPWAVTDPARDQFLGVVEDSFAPVIHDGAMMDMVRGRTISVQRETDRVAGYMTMEHLLRLAQAADPATANRWRSMVKGWVTRDTGAPLLPTAPLARVALFSAVLSDPAVAPAAELTEHRQFPVMDRAVHRRPAWTYAISMSSRRIGYYEAINLQNKRGWHTGSGMTYLYGSDDTQFTDGFWPTVDPYRLPGTTVDTTPLPGGAGATARPNAAWVGGVTSVCGRYGLVGMAVRGITAPGATQVQARKAWFCLDQQVIALGAAITGGGTAGRPVVTTVENRNLHENGTGELTVDGVEQPAGAGWSGEFAAARWAHLEGVGGYVFPAGPALRAKREDRTGTWRAIDSGSAAGTTDPVTRRYLTLWLDHGVEPRNASYAYVLLPGASAQRTAQVAASPATEILANTPDVQAVRLLNRDIVMAGFFVPGSVAGITVSAAAAVIIEPRGRVLTIAVADPTRATAPIHITIDRATTRVLRHDPELAVTPGPTTTITATLSATVGGTRTARLMLA